MLILTRNGAISVLHKVLAAGITQTPREIPTAVTLGREDGTPTTA